MSEASQKNFPSSYEGRSVYILQRMGLCTQIGLWLAKMGLGTGKWRTLCLLLQQTIEK